MQQKDFAFSILLIKGNDAEKFLQGQLTCDVSALKKGDFSHGAQCTPKGRVIYNFVVVRLAEDSFGIRVHASMAETALTSLKKYAVFFKVSISIDESILVNFKNTRGCQNTATKLPTERNLEEYGGILSGINLTPCLTEEWVTKTESSQISLIDPYPFLLKEGIVTVLPNLSDRFTPEELGLTNIGAVNFKKGCYTGQEIIARMHYRGAHKRGLGLFSLETSNFSDLQDEIYFLDKVSGYVINIASASENNFLILASVPTEFIDSEELTLNQQRLTPISLGNKGE
jgi:folate-binding protein YgfZ